MGFALLCAVIGPEICATLLTTKPIASCAHALDILLVFTLSSDWLFKICSLLLIGRCYNSVFLILPHSIENFENFSSLDSLSYSNPLLDLHFQDEAEGNFCACSRKKNYPEY